MKHELIEYATYTLVYKDRKYLNYSFVCSNASCSILFSIILITSYLPLLLFKPWTGAIPILLWIFILIYGKLWKNPDNYEKALLLDGSYLLLCTFSASYMLKQFLFFAIWPLCVLPLFLIMASFLLVYDIIVFVRVRRKAYSKKNNSSCGLDHSFIVMMSTIGAFLGSSVISTNFSQSSTSMFFQVLSTLFLSVFSFFGMVLIQKFFLLRMLKNH